MCQVGEVQRDEDIFQILNMLEGQYSWKIVYQNITYILLMFS